MCPSGLAVRSPAPPGRSQALGTRLHPLLDGHTSDGIHVRHPGLHLGLRAPLSLSPSILGPHLPESCPLFPRPPGIQHLLWQGLPYPPHLTSHSCWKETPRHPASAYRGLLPVLWWPQSSQKQMRNTFLDFEDCLHDPPLPPTSSPRCPCPPLMAKGAAAQLAFCLQVSAVLP